jgi:hypothetical protein
MLLYLSVPYSSSATADALMINVKATLPVVAAAVAASKTLCGNGQKDEYVLLLLLGLLSPTGQ